MQNEGKEVPSHMKLPDLQDILKMRPLEMGGTEEEGIESIGNDITAFTFIVEHLVPAIIGKKTWNKYKCMENISKTFTPSDEAFLYLILSNSYELWKSANGSKVGAGKLTKDGTNKKYCGWTKQGIKVYNDILHKVKKNREAAGAKKVEENVRDKLRERDPNWNRRSSEAANRRRRRKRKRGDDSSDDNDDDLESVDAENDLSEAFANIEEI
jgi:hypothetical protein